MVDDPSWSRSADRTGFRVDHRESGSVSVWQADRELSGAGAVGGLEWELATTGAYHQTGEVDVAQGMGLRTSCKVWFARGQARNRRWCAVEHREIDWAARSSSQRSSK